MIKSIIINIIKTSVKCLLFERFHIKCLQYLKKFSVEIDYKPRATIKLAHLCSLCTQTGPEWFITSWVAYAGIWYGVSLPAAAAKLLPTLCDPIDGSPPDSPVPGILQARTLEWVAISFSNTWKWKVKVKSLSRPTLSDPMDCSLPGSSVHGIFQARVLEWGAIAFSYHYLLMSLK